MSCTERRNGFVLMEAVIALAIMSLVAIGLLGMTATQVRTADRASVLLVAQALAQDRMTAIEIVDRDQLLSLPDSLSSGTFDVPFDAFTWQAQVAEVKDEQDLFDVQLIVTGHGHEFPLNMMLHRAKVLSQTASGSF